VSILLHRTKHRVTILQSDSRGFRFNFEVEAGVGQNTFFALTICQSGRQIRGASFSAGLL